jgi:hypothetical protein
MNKQIICILLIFQLTLTPFLLAQNLNNSANSESVSLLFKDQTILPINLNFSIKDLKKYTNDSTYIKTTLSYKNNQNNWQKLDVEIRARGKSRRETCYYVPVKIKIKKSNAKSTLFEGNKKLKLVMPCLLAKDNNDNIIKEYIAYKLYEVISPYNFKTRLVTISLSEIRGKKVKEHLIKGILIEDDKKVAKRHHGKIVERSIHPLAQDNITCVQNALFQFMIGNVDFSIQEQHNSKLLYIDNKIFPLPYDFDMTGLVNPSYGNPPLGMASLTQRKFRGVKRDTLFMEQVRKEFIKNKVLMQTIVESYENEFENKSEFNNAKEYVSTFFQVLLNDKRFNKEIIEQMRY